MSPSRLTHYAWRMNDGDTTYPLWKCGGSGAPIAARARTIVISDILDREGRFRSWRADRLDPVLPFSPGRFERHGFEHYRHETLFLYAVLETKSGEIIGKTLFHPPARSS